MTNLESVYGKKYTKIIADAIDIFKSGVKAADPYNAIKQSFQITKSILSIKTITGKQFKYNLESYNQIFLVGAGKAVAPMAVAMEDILGNRLNGGYIIVNYGYYLPLKKLEYTEAGHPIPNFNGLEGTKRIISIIEKCDNKTLVLCLFSGGGSALLVQPLDCISLHEIQECTHVLISCSATIDEINAVRKHISQVKGGLLAKKAYPATVITLIVSDVIGDKLDTIASGPTVPDRTTFSDVKNILKKYNMGRDLPKAIQKVISDGLRGKIKETPKASESLFKNVRNLIICNNSKSLRESKKKAEKLGYNTMILTSSLCGEVKETARIFSSLAHKIRSLNLPVKVPACIISGGEPTVKIKGRGIGGRNQELALYTAIEIKDLKNILFLSSGTDGIDGITDAAGAYVTGETVRIEQKV